MYSFNFPDMLGSVNSNLLKDKAAIESNLTLLLSAEKLSLFGDPFYGSQLKPFIFEQGEPLIVDLLIDELSVNEGKYLLYLIK